MLPILRHLAFICQLAEAYIPKLPKSKAESKVINCNLQSDFLPFDIDNKN